MTLHRSVRRSPYQLIKEDLYFEIHGMKTLRDMVSTLGTPPEIMLVGVKIHMTMVLLSVFIILNILIKKMVTIGSQYFQEDSLVWDREKWFPRSAFSKELIYMEGLQCFPRFFLYASFCKFCKFGYIKVSASFLQVLLHASLDKSFSLSAGLNSDMATRAGV